MPPRAAAGGGGKDNDRRKATEVDLARKEAFQKSTRAAAMELDAFDRDRDRKLDFREFSKLVREREMAIQTEEALRKRFKALDTDGSGYIEAAEFIKWALKEALQRSSARVVDLLSEWDTDGSGEIELPEFIRVVRHLGFDALEEEIKAVFDEIDVNKSGSLEIRELKQKLNEAVREEAAEGDKDYGQLQRHAIRQVDWREGVQDAQAKIAEAVQAAAPAAAAPAGVATNAIEIARQLRATLGSEEGLGRVMDLFRMWDVDGDGQVTKKEFRKAVMTLGFTVERKEVDALFELLDKDKGGSIEYRELNRFLKRDAKLSGRPGSGDALESAAKSRAAASRPADEPVNQPRILRGSHLRADGSTDVPLIEQLTDALAANWGRVIDLFKEWCSNEEGTQRSAEAP